MMGLLALLSLVAGAAVLVIDNRRRRLPVFAFPLLEIDRWSLRQLLIASFLTLFAELAFIRWIAVEIRVFAYFKNLALLVCFLGFGLGCALAQRGVKMLLSPAVITLLVALVRAPIPGRDRFFELLSGNLGAAGDIEIWKTGLRWNSENFLVAAAVVYLLLFLLVASFIPLGQIVSRQINLAPRALHAYSWNLAGSLAGIVIFFAACREMLPPTVWLGGVLVGWVLLQHRMAQRLVVASLVLPLTVLTRDRNTRDHFTIWTPYQQIEFQRFALPDGESCCADIKVNHTGYQTIANLAPDFLRRHPGLLRESPEANPYNLPFRFARPEPRVLIVGAGAGNDAAAALRNRSSSVDAVEIDPAIWELGKREHPEHPYDSPRVSVHLTDARAFLRRTPRQYDLILFGLLDSHTQLSDYANMRMDNFVYTAEAFREARQHLSPDGVLFVKFEVNRPWLGRRLADLLAQTFGKPPLVFFADSGYTVSATCFVISASERVEQAVAADPQLARLVGDPPAFLKEKAIPLTTDDWPYLYHQGRWIPRTFIAVSALVLLLGLSLYFYIPEARKQAPSLFFFSMGAGFLVLETQVISRLALYFGTTWQVNGIVIGAILIALLAANSVIDWRRVNPPRLWLVMGLLASLAAAYLLPLDRIPGSPTLGGLLAAAVFSVPVFFAGLLFAVEFQRVPSPSAALGANMLGAVVGGLLENLSLMVGLRGLLLVAIVLYGLAALGLRSRGRSVGAPVGKEWLKTGA